LTKSPSKASLRSLKRSKKAPTTQALKNIKALFLDVDGVLTDGSIWWLGPGEWRRTFNIYDGYGIRELVKAGYITAMITGSNSEDIRQRKERLDIHYIYEGCEEKISAFEDLLNKTGLKEKEIAYIGDDLPDIPLLKRVGFSATVPAAMPEVKKVVHYITKREGGKGAVRELCDMLLATKKKKGK
jgi:3-deoxy-D-manno-octulosonate 8-phosphate phosphatase (KDO 8-P phosphatase)